MSKVRIADRLVRNFILKRYPFFSTSIDGYLKWTPFFCVLFLHGCRVKMRDNTKERIMISLIAEAILKTIIYPVKRIVRERRPDLSVKKHSFPSGHSATSFMGAELLRQQMKDHYPVISFSGYAIGIVTGILRLLKNRHWLSDVISGAIIGFIAARMASRIFDLIKKHQELKYPGLDDGKVIPLYNLSDKNNFLKKQ